jgi:hypothetical protein
MNVWMAASRRGDTWAGTIRPRDRNLLRRKDICHPEWIALIGGQRMDEETK